MAEKEEYIIALKDQFLKPFQGLRNSVAQFNSQIKNTQSNVQNMSSGVSSGIGGIVKSFGPLLAGLASIGTIKSIVQLGMDAEQAQVSFEVMLGSAEKAKKMVGDLKAMGAATPFEFTDLQSASKTLLAFGFEGKAVIPTLQALGDVSGGNAEKLQSLATVFGQISSLGKLQGGDLLQLINVGFNPLEGIAKRTGKTMKTLKDEMSKGLITFDMVQQSFADATSEGGRFYGMMEKQSQTTAGRLSTLQDQIGMIGASIGTALLPTVNKGMDKVSYAFDFLKNNISQLQLMIAPLLEAFQPIIDVFKDMAADMGLMSSEGNVLKSIFNGIGSVIRWVSPLIKFFANNAAFAIKVVYNLANIIWTLIKPIAKLLGFKDTSFGLKSNEQVKKEDDYAAFINGGGDTGPKTLNDLIAGGSGKGATAEAAHKSKTKKISDDLTGVSGGRPTSITINVGSLIKENINQITNINGSADLSNFMDKLKASLMTMLNDSQVIAQG